MEQALASLPNQRSANPRALIEEVSKGSEVEPGIYLDRSERRAWVVWDWHPADPEATITVLLTEVAVPVAAAMLGVGREQVPALVEAGKLEQADTGAITVASIIPGIPD